MEKPGVEEIGDSQDNVAIGDPREEASADEIAPAVGIDFGAGEAEARFTGKGNAACFAARQAAILGKAHGVGIATVEHFLDNLVEILSGVAGIGSLKGCPVFAKDALERGFVNMFVRREFGHVAYNAKRFVEREVKTLS